MRNMYPDACTVCRAEVAPGDGVLHWDGDRWTVTHAEGCPRERQRNEFADSLIRQVVIVLADPQSPVRVTRSALRAMGRLVDTGWLDLETCRTYVLSAPAVRRMDRLELEVFLEHFLPDHTRAS